MNAFAKSDTQLETVPETDENVFEDEEPLEEVCNPTGSMVPSKHPNIMSAEGFRLQILGVPKNVQPVVAFINPKSGGRQGIRVYRKLQCILNPRQVFDLTKGGPNPGLTFIASLPNSRVICCGGDGTVGWILSALDELGWEESPPVGIIPLGTGNDLARCLKWGGGYEGENLDKILQQIVNAEIVQLDRWRIKVNSIPVAEDQDSKAEEGDKVPYDVMNNYFSIGVDASIAHKFHVMRENHPEKFQSRVRNKFRYFEIASHENFAASCKDLADNLEVECDGRLLMLGRRSLEGIAVLNIPSIYGGTDLWGSEHDSRSLSRDCRSISASSATEFCLQG
jgi:diacylglycerol kinase (ATP)